MNCVFAAYLSCSSQDISTILHRSPSQMDKKSAVLPGSMDLTRSYTNGRPAHPFAPDSGPNIGWVHLFWRGEVKAKGGGSEGATTRKMHPWSPLRKLHLRGPPSPTRKCIHAICERALNSSRVSSFSRFLCPSHVNKLNRFPVSFQVSYSQMYLYHFLGDNVRAFCLLSLRVPLTRCRCPRAGSPPRSAWGAS